MNFLKTFVASGRPYIDEKRTSATPKNMNGMYIQAISFQTTTTGATACTCWHRLAQIQPYAYLGPDVSTQLIITAFS